MVLDNAIPGKFSRSQQFTRCDSPSFWSYSPESALDVATLHSSSYGGHKLITRIPNLWSAKAIRDLAVHHVHNLASYNVSQNLLWLSKLCWNTLQAQSRSVDYMSGQSSWRQALNGGRMRLFIRWFIYLASEIIHLLWIIRPKTKQPSDWKLHHCCEDNDLTHTVGISLSHIWYFCFFHS